MDHGSGKSHTGSRIPIGRRWDTTSGRWPTTRRRCSSVGATKSVILDPYSYSGWNIDDIRLYGFSGAPVITSPTTVVAEVDQPFNYQIVASNAPSGYGASGLPDGLSIHAATGLISGMPVELWHLSRHAERHKPIRHHEEETHPERHLAAFGFPGVPEYLRERRRV